MEQLRGYEVTDACRALANNDPERAQLLRVVDYRTIACARLTGKPLPYNGRYGNVGEQSGYTRDIILNHCKMGLGTLSWGIQGRLATWVYYSSARSEAESPLFQSKSHDHTTTKELHNPPKVARSRAPHP